MKGITNRYYLSIPFYINYIVDFLKSQNKFSYFRNFCQKLSQKKCNNFFENQKTHALFCQKPKKRVQIYQPLGWY